MSLRGIFVCIFRVARYYLPRDPLSLSVGRTRVLQPGKLQIIRGHRVTPFSATPSPSLSLHCSSASSSVDTFTSSAVDETAATPSARHRNLSIHFSSDITTRLADLLTVPSVLLQWNLLVYRAAGAEPQETIVSRGQSHPRATLCFVNTPAAPANNDTGRIRKHKFRGRLVLISGFFDATSDIANERVHRRVECLRND